VHPRSSLRGLFLGHGLVVALTLTLVVTSVLAGTGLFMELTGGRRTVVAERRPTPQTLVASRAVADIPRPLAPDAADDAEIDPTADPGADHADRAESPTSGPGGSEQVGSGPAAEAVQATSRRGTAAFAAWAASEPGASEAPQEQGDAAAESQGPTEGPTEAPTIRARPTPSPHGPPRAAADLPIVMYHHVGPLPPNPDAFRRDLTVSPTLFERTLKQLADQSVEAVTMAELFEHFSGGAALPKRSVLLTFDDGYDDVYQYAFPLLQQYGMVGTLFITTGFVGRPGYLTWQQIEEMAAAGMEIGAHSSNHADFTLISPNELRRQLVEPKAILESHVGQPVRFMAYPAGKYNPRVMAATRVAGYEAAVTVLYGTHHVPANAFELRRVRARGADSVAAIIARMTPPIWRQ
jgi:peptidoglycan/xylan/chitin deacetylase (PgdA/CDA1 family)